MMFKRFLWLSFTLLFCVIGQSNDSTLLNAKFNTVEFRLHSGQIIKNSEQVKELLERGYASNEIRVGVQSYGKKKWEQIFKYPTYGFGLYYADLGSEDTLGSPSAMFVYFNAPFFQRKRMSLRYDVGVGVSYGFQHFNQNTNSANDVIGSFYNVYIALALELKYRLSNRFDLSLGYDLTHFSNGSTRTPNLGVNLVGFNAGVSYHFTPLLNNTKEKLLGHRAEPYYIHREISDFKPYWEPAVYIGSGLRSTSASVLSRDVYYFTSVVVGEVHRHYGHKGTYGGGVDVFYDQSLTEGLGVTPFTDDVYLGYHLSHELKIQRFSVVTQAGGYMSEVKKKGKFFFRVGLKQQVLDRLFWRVSLKTLDGFASDWIEWGVGVSLKKKKE